EAVGVLISAPVAVGGVFGQQDRLAGSYRAAAELDVLSGVAGQHIGDREQRYPAHELLDGAGHQVGPGTQQVELVGMGQQGVGEVHDLAGGGLVSGGEEYQGQLDHLVLGELVAFVRGDHQRAEQVVGGVLAALCGEVGQV